MKIQSQRGETLMGFMAAIVIAAVVLTGAVNGMMSVSKTAEDNKLIADANDRARTIIDLLSYELRFAGSGIPFQQSNFLMTDATLGTYALPITTSATATSITFRYNGKGRVATLSATFNPSAQTTINVVSNTGLSSGDTVYISDAVVGGTYGYVGTISSISGTTVTLTNPHYATGATFAPGSLVEPVQSVTLSSNATGIVRTSGTQSVTLAPSSSFTITYLSTTGATLTPPLTTTNISTDLAALSLTVNVPTTRKLSNKTTYTASLSTKIALRELNVFH